MTGVPARAVAALVVALALVSGVLLGIASDRWLLLPGGRHHGGVAMRGGPSPDWVTERLARDLDLTPEQRTRVDSIVTRRMAERRALMEPVRTRMRQLFDSTRSDVEAVLTPAQRVKLESLETRHGLGPDGPPPPRD